MGVSFIGLIQSIQLMVTRMKWSERFPPSQQQDRSDGFSILDTERLDALRCDLEREQRFARYRETAFGWTHSGESFGGLPALRGPQRSLFLLYA